MSDSDKKLNLFNKEKIVENGKKNLNSYFPFTLLDNKLYYVNNKNKLSYKNLSNKEIKINNNIKLENFKSIKTSNDNNYLIISNENEIILY